jgi:heme/copper-type cytochrome/quinol oxidase subunit 3
MSDVAVIPQSAVEPSTLPSRGVVGMACLIVAEAAIFIIFVVAYLYYLGKSSLFISRSPRCSRAGSAIARAGLQSQWC